MTNRLGGETSPYLQQHAGNPVHWHPWDEEALAIARTQDKPILLSVGYSACHWCHVMAHESFEDPDVAAVMNRLFVNIKVDREERPDIDQIYQTAHQVMTGRAGGWPLTMFLTPQQKPFFGGTYFPVRPLHGLPGFGDLLERVAQAYRERRSDIDAQNESLMEILGAIRPESVANVTLTDEPIASAVRELGGSFDERYGGLGSAPKFPHPAELAFCLRAAQSSGDGRLRDLVLLTLERMALGGIYDQLGGGFCRYSVDAHWSIPHFEKMLYDNALLLKLYADAWTFSSEPLFQRVCQETASWVIREMQSPQGGYYSSIDADSEHEEGKFYVWGGEEVAALLAPAELEVASAHYGLDLPPNFEGRAWNLRVTRPIADVATTLGKPEAECRALLDAARGKLFAARERRIRPGRDEKILASWNALMIEGMARAARIFSRDDWLQSARRATGFLANGMWRDGRLLATSRDGQSRLNAYLDDHAFLAAALLELLQAGYRNADLELAILIADALLARFEDRGEGGFFFTSHDHEALILRPKPGPDNATPSGNGVAAFALQRLGNLLAEPRYLQAAERTLQLFFPSMQQQAGAFSTLDVALMERLTPPRTVILRGALAELQGWQRELSKRYLPDVQALGVDRAAHGLPLALNKPADADVNAYVCHGVSCLAPVRSLGKLLETLEIQAT